MAGTVVLTAAGQRLLARAKRAGLVPEPLALPEGLPGTIGAVAGVDRVWRRWTGPLGRVELDFVPNLATFDGQELAVWMDQVLAGEALREPERLAAALADAWQAALDAVTLTVSVVYLDRVRAEATRGLGT